MANEQSSDESHHRTVEDSREDAREQLREIMSDDEITEWFDIVDREVPVKRIIRRSEYFQLAHYALVILLVIFFGISSVTFGFVPLAPKQWFGFSNFFFGLAMATFVVLVIIDLIEKRIRNTALSQGRHRALTKLNLWLLEKHRPDLYAFHEVTNMFNEEKDGAATRRDFWVGIAVNFAFLVLGFLLNYALSHMGLFR